MNLTASMWVLTMSACLAGCGQQNTAEAPAHPAAPAAPPASITTPPAATKPAAKTFAPVPDQNALHNGYILTDRVISGAQPAGEASFKALQDLGVKTIISVDSAKPDVETAKRFGINYIHLPIGYNGIEPAKGKAIAKAIAEKPGPVYVHCHHGKHRSAAAVAVACVYNGMLKPEQAEDVLKTFGTGENYKGLWKAARDARPLPAGELENLQIEFVETAKIAATAEAMVEVDHRWDHLRAVQKAGWKSPPDHPDIDPAHEALQLQELLHEMGRADSAHSKVADFQRFLAEGAAGAKDLRDALSAMPVNTPVAEAAMKAVENSCTACHKSYRD